MTSKNTDSAVCVEKRHHLKTSEDRYMRKRVKQLETYCKEKGLSPHPLSDSEHLHSSSDFYIYTPGAFSNLPSIDPSEVFINSVNLQSFLVIESQISEGLYNSEFSMQPSTFNTLNELPQ
ncbi:29341_t:CDS:2, partial [Racocetra persica]